jgi:hypothetical protein
LFNIETGYRRAEIIKKIEKERERGAPGLEDKDMNI